MNFTSWLNLWPELISSFQGRGFLEATVSGRYALALALCGAVAMDRHKRSSAEVPKWCNREDQTTKTWRSEQWSDM